MTLNVDPKVLLGPPMTGDYTPAAYLGNYFAIRKQPPFSLTTVSEMLTDPRIIFGLWLIKGPIIAKSKFFIDCDNPDVKEFISGIVTKFWRSDAERALKSLEWGFSCSEVLYTVEDGRITFSGLKDLSSLDCRCLTINGTYDGARVRSSGLGGNRKRVDIPKMKSLWTVHDRNHHRWYGKSRLYGAYLPWLELWSEGGFRDSRRLFFHKYAYNGGVMYHPPGVSQIETTGGEIAAVIPNKDIARDIMEKFKNGAVVTLPNTLSESGQAAWKIEPPQSNMVPQGLLEHGDGLKDELWEGMGIPPEVARAEGTGAYAGRRIPEEAFYAILQRDVNWTIYDFKMQIIRPLVLLNFGDVKFDIIPFGLLTPSAEEEKNEKAAEAQPQVSLGEENEQG